MADNKKTSLETALKQIEKDFGEGTIMKLGTRDTVEVPSISTGSFGLDKALGIDGLPKGRVVEIYGPEYAKALGVDIDELLISQPDTGEQALEVTDKLVESGGLDVIVVDSVAALVPRAELEGNMGDSHVGLQARLMSQALRKITGSIQRKNTLVIFCLLYTSPSPRD